MTWIPVHSDIWEHPHTLELASLLDIPPIYAAAHLIRLWLWALDNQEDGSLAALSPRSIAAAAAWPGNPDDLLAALVASGAISQDGLIHNWQRHARLLEARAEARSRMARFRHRQDDVNRFVTRTFAERAPNVRPVFATKKKKKSTPQESEEGGGGNARAREDPDHHHHTALSPSLHQAFADARAALGDLTPDELDLLATTVSGFPSADHAIEAAKCRAYFKRPPNSLAVAYDEWISNGRQLQLITGAVGPPAAAAQPLPDPPPPADQEDPSSWTPEYQAWHQARKEQWKTNNPDQDTA